MYKVVVNPKSPGQVIYNLDPRPHSCDDDIFETEFKEILVRNPAKCRTADDEVTVAVVRGSDVPQFWCLDPSSERAAAIAKELADLLEKLSGDPYRAAQLEMRINYGGFLKRFTAHAHFYASNSSHVIAQLGASPNARRPPREATNDVVVPLSTALPSVRAPGGPFVDVLRTAPATFFELLRAVQRWWEAPDGWRRMSGFSFVVLDAALPSSRFAIRAAAPKG